MEAAGAIRLWREQPDRFVRDVFRVEPDEWQAEALRLFPVSPRLAMKACKGPGKSAVLAWLSWNFLLTRPHPKVAAVSVTADNLADGLWTEMSKWQQRSELLQTAFTWTKTRIYANDHPETWWMSARAWSQSATADQQANALAGLHADYLLFILDEAGGIPDAVMAAAEAGLANADPTQGREAHLLMAGNPTHLEGPLYRACSSERGLWALVEITADPDDPKRTPRVSVGWARQQIEKYGRDNPWVLVNVFGRFPPSSMNALLGPDDVAAAMRRAPTDDGWRRLARILGVDVARYGLDQSVMAPRQGQMMFPLVTARNLDSIQGAGWTARRIADFYQDERQQRADACFVDDTGGWGAGWIDQLRALNHTPVGVAFSGKADDPRYYNKRTEMHFRLAEAIKKGGLCLPNDPELAAELTAHTYVFRGDKMWVEEKEQVQEKLGRSPDRADGCALTFAFDVAPPLRDNSGADMPRGLLAAVHDSYGGQPGDVYNPMG